MVVSKRRFPILTMAAASLLLLSGFVFSVFVFGSQAARASGGGFNTPGNILISDQFNNRAVEINRSKQIVWSFGSGDPTLCNPGPGTIIGLNDAERIGDGLTILAGTGIPGGGADPLMPNGCVDNRVIVVDQSGNIVWQYGQAGMTGSGPNLLNVPVFAIQLPNHNIAIVDQSNERVIVVDKNTKQIVWHYGCPTCNQLNNPNSVEQLPNGNFLIADENNNRVIVVNQDHQIVFQYTDQLKFAAFASRLPNGDTLITDSGHARIVQINQSRRVVFQYFTDTQPGSNSAPLPTNAVQLANGSIIIADQFNDRIIIIDRNKTIDFQYGMLNVVGNGPDQLDGPYTAFVIGDYTGQTPPPAHF